MAQTMPPNWHVMAQNSPMAGKTQKSLTSLERLEAQIRALPDGTPQGAAWEAALVGWFNGGGHPDLVKGWGWTQWPGLPDFEHMPLGRFARVTG